MHLFFSYSIFPNIWRLFIVLLGDLNWRPIDCIQTIMVWGATKGKYKSLPFYVFWEIWCARNRLIFQDFLINISRIHGNILQWMWDRALPSPNLDDFSVRGRPHHISLPAIYFYGAQRDGLGGCGAWIKLAVDERFHIYWNGGS